MKNYIYAIILILSPVLLKGQGDIIFQNERFAIHPRAGIMYNEYLADFNQFQNSVDCGIFEEGSGWAYNASISFEKAIGDNKMFPGIGIGFFNRSGDLLLENKYRSRNLETGNVSLVRTNNIIEADISYIELFPEFRYTVNDYFIKGPLRALLGIRLGIPVQSSFHQKEEIASPRNAVFVNNGSRSQNRDIADGEIESISSINYGASIGLENMVKISPSTFFTQQLVLDYNFNDITSDATWKTYAIRLDLGLRFSIQKEQEKPKEIPLPDPVPIEEPVKELPPPVEVLAVTITPDLKSSKIKTGNELLASTPIVNAVFFDRNSAEIPADYNISGKSRDSYLGVNALEAHKSLLPRIAEIVNNNPKATIRLESATSGAEYEPAGMELSVARAKAVELALVSLGVSKDRIEIAPRLTPKYQSNQKFQQGITENQRVDIIVNDAPLQEWVDIQKYAELEASIDVNVEQQNIEDEIKITTNKDTEPIVVNSSGVYDLSFIERLNSKQSNSVVEVRAKSNNSLSESSTNIDLNSLTKENVDLNLDKFEAILRFDYNSSVLSQENKILLSQLSEKLPLGSTIIILGSTDALGTDQRNQELADERATNTMEYIKSISGDKFEFETGTNTQKFSEDEPQGRFLNRSIRIKVKK